MVFAGFAAARWGNRRSIGVAVGTMGVGLLLYAAAPTCLLGLPALLLADLWEGVVEGFGTPFVQDMHRDDPGRYVNFTHGFWSLGTFAFALHAGALPPGAVTPLLFLLFFLSGVGSSPFWPSIQSLCVDRLPQLDSTLAFIVLSCAGVQLSYLAMVALVIASAPAHPRTRWRNALSPNCATC